MTGFDGFDRGPLPIALIAMTVNVYVVPSLSAWIVSGLAVASSVRPDDAMIL